MRANQRTTVYSEHSGDLYDAERALGQGIAEDGGSIDTSGIAASVRVASGRDQGTCNAVGASVPSPSEKAERADFGCYEGPNRRRGGIAAANRVEHYEIAAYGSTQAFAKTLGVNEAVSLLEATLAEERKADESSPSWPKALSIKKRCAPHPFRGDAGRVFQRSPYNTRCRLDLNGASS